MKLCQITVNDLIIEFFKETIFVKLIFSQMVMKLVRIIIINLSLNVVHLHLMVVTFVRIFTCM